MHVQHEYAYAATHLNVTYQDWQRTNLTHSGFIVNDIANVYRLRSK